MAEIIVTNIDRSTNATGDSIRSVSYLRDDKPMCVSCPETPEIIEAISDFIVGNCTDENLIRIISGIDFVKECRENIAPKISKISENLVFDGNHVYFKQQSFADIALDEILEDHLVRLIKAGTSDTDLKAWAAFTERLYGNECKHTRKHIVRWLIAQRWLTLDSKGRLIGYRGCAWDDELDCPVSVHAGFAIVDGVHTDGQIPNRVGSIVEMPRKMVNHNPSEGCSTGLHVGTYNYAQGWAPYDGAILRVAVAPEDIVSVPTDCDSAKIRCCKFEVLDCKRLTNPTNWQHDNNNESSNLAEDYYNDLTYNTDDDRPDEYWDAMAEYFDQEPDGDSFYW